MLTMQDALARLTEFWSARGCLIAQPMNTEVGAGTNNPATALRVLGPEPWRVAYVEPSVRPDDSRYGDNPNRLQTHTQFQVILKPEPGDPQEIYLESLEALGVPVARHDVRFVEDNWTWPAGGAWGLGWEVWLDGLEITQFTYFQQAGGRALDPVSVELTYGVDRIVMALQGVTHFKDIVYAPGLSFGEVFGQGEYEMSRYYLDDADIATNRQLFDAYEAEAQRLIDARLPVPAHSYLLKCSHTFNVLDSRGAISTTERARAFARMRALAGNVASLWLDRREELGYPLGRVRSPATPIATSTYPEITEPQPLAFEIGIEELPAAEVSRTAEAVRDALLAELSGSRLGYGELRTVSTPRRVGIVIDDVRPRESDSEQTIRGPRYSAAYDDSGAPTKAAMGFARSQGVEPGELQRLEMNGGEYVGVTRKVPGRPAAEVLAEILPEVVSGLRGDRNIRWSAPGLSFSRPIRWILALLGDQVVPFAVSTLESRGITRPLRGAKRPEVPVASAAEYLGVLRECGIVADPEERRERILRVSADLAASVGGHIDADGERATLDEVVDLVEHPTPILGRFDESYLGLPADVLTTVMKKHQRYLPVRDAEGKLLPYFIAVANGECDHDLVRSGNEAVLRARYEDALFFWRGDLAVEPSDMKRDLVKLTFEERLGSMADRAERIRAIAANLADKVDLSGEERATLARAAELAKFDLASKMVIELSSLAGVMAREYARRAGEPDAVASALFEMELPRQAGDQVPATIPGALLSLADRFDLLSGLFGLRQAPSGSSDPFGMRRAALGVISVLLAHPRLAQLGVDEGVEISGRHQPIEVSAAARSDTVAFVSRRLEQYLLDSGYAVDVVRAVVPLAATPRRAEQTATELAKLRNDARFQGVVTTVQRVQRIVPVDTRPRYDPALFDSSAEGSLHAALATVSGELGPEPRSLDEFVAIANGLVEPVDRFFVDVLVMADDPRVRANRLGLLAAVRDLAEPYLDWSAL